MPKELVAIAVQQPVLQTTKRDPYPPEISASKWTLAHPNAAQS